MMENKQKNQWLMKNHPSECSRDSLFLQTLSRDSLSSGQAAESPRRLFVSIFFLFTGSIRFPLSLDIFRKSIYCLQMSLSPIGEFIFPPCRSLPPLFSLDTKKGYNLYSTHFPAFLPYYNGLYDKLLHKKEVKSGDNFERWRLTPLLLTAAETTWHWDSTWNPPPSSPPHLLSIFSVSPSTSLFWDNYRFYHLS